MDRWSGFGARQPSLDGSPCGTNKLAWLSPEICFFVLRQEAICASGKVSLYLIMEESYLRNVLPGIASYPMDRIEELLP